MGGCRARGGVIRGVRTSKAIIIVHSQSPGTVPKTKQTNKKKTKKKKTTKECQEYTNTLSWWI
jgi:hypothetical protein